MVARLELELGMRLSRSRCQSKEEAVISFHEAVAPAAIALEPLYKRLRRVFQHDPGNQQPEVGKT